MKKYAIAVVLLVVSVCTATRTYAQEDRSDGIIRSLLLGLEYEVKAGVSIGGTSPLPLPQEIRKIEGYSPTFCFSICLLYTSDAADE